jgi:serine O-acetyltransferase
MSSGNYPPPIINLCKLILKITRFFYHCEICASNKIGPGLYIGHPYGITINSSAILGSNINIHKGVTIGQENRGTRKGAPIIGDSVWIGINSTIVGKISIGNDVLIAPNTYVNCDIPDHSVVFGNPCVIKHRDNATDGYINHKYNA